MKGPPGSRLETLERADVSQDQLRHVLAVRRPQRTF
jgi:hypothetical protein